MVKDTLYKSESNEWATPQHIFDGLNEEFNFTLDPCASHDNAKCDKYYTIEEDGLQQDWSNEMVFMNPPYGKDIKDWVTKAYEESLKGATVVCLIPARTDTRYWHEVIFKHATEVRFVKGRLKFGGQNNAAPFPSAVIIFKQKVISGHEYARM